MIRRSKASRERVFESICETIGETPLVRLGRWRAGPHSIYAKLEYMNPGGSVKDRIGLEMIRQAEKDGQLKPGGTIVEPTAGNTGIGLAMVAAVKGYKTILVIPRRFSKEKQTLVEALGAEVVHTPTKKGMEGAIEKARELAAKIPDSFVPQQFANPGNPLAHYTTTGPEIYRALDGKVDVFVVGAGTTGTLMGAGRYLKERIPALLIAAVEPQGSILGGGKPGKHKIEGIGVDDLTTPKFLDRSLINRVVTVKDRDAHRTLKELARTEGMLVGSSAGAAAWAAKHIVEMIERGEVVITNRRAMNVVTIFPDGSERYLSKRIYGHFTDWRR